ncbi:trp operon leader peptide [Streptomyces sparsogenes]
MRHPRPRPGRNGVSGHDGRDDRPGRRTGTTAARAAAGADAGRGTCGRVRGMFARLTMTWWWTAHPAAH